MLSVRDWPVKATSWQQARTGSQLRSQAAAARSLHGICARRAESGGSGTKPLDAWSIGCAMQTRQAGYRRRNQFTSSSAKAKPAATAARRGSGK